MIVNAKNVVTISIVQGLDVEWGCETLGSIGTQRVFGDDELEMRVILTQRGNEAFGGKEGGRAAHNESHVRLLRPLAPD